MSKLGQWLIYTGGAGALGYGAYFAVQQKEVLKYEKEVGDLLKLVDKEKKAVATNATLITEAEAKVAALAKQEQTTKSQLAAAQAKLEAIQKEVAKLEGDYTKTTTEQKSLASRLTALRTDSQRVKEALTLGEKSLTIARQKAEDAKALLNPLHHPAIAGKLGTGKK